MTDKLETRYRILSEQADSKPMIRVHYYSTDKENNRKTKSIAIGIFTHFDSGNERLFLSSGITIPVIDIISIDGELFGN